MCLFFLSLDSLMLVQGRFNLEGKSEYREAFASSRMFGM